MLRRGIHYLSLLIMVASLVGVMAILAVARRAEPDPRLARFARLSAFMPGQTRDAVAPYLYHCQGYSNATASAVSYCEVRLDESATMFALVAYRTGWCPCC